jgi:TonB family protein
MKEAVLSLPAFSDQPLLIKRLAFEFIEATRELRANPKLYIAGALRGDSFSGYRRTALFRLGLAIGVVVYTIFFGVTLVFWSLNARHGVDFDAKAPRILYTPYQPPIWLRSSVREAHGGGGGGREAQTPATEGAPPPFESEHPIMAPTTRPTVQPPALPMIERLLGDPSQNLRRDDSIPTGLPDGVPGPSSDGPGSKGGIGTGENGGVGKGLNAGLGNGTNGGRNGGEYNGLPGGGRPTDAVNTVDTKPVALNLPRPNYTEEARTNKIQGTVRARVLVGADGLIKQVTIVRGLPGGLNEEAIRAAFQMRFRPATKGGRAVAFWTTLEVDFNLR